MEKSGQKNNQDCELQCSCEGGRCDRRTSAAACQDAWINFPRRMNILV